jgi:GntR family transcriptional regulator
MAEPMYRQIADDLRGKIDSGEIAHGAQLPTEIELMDEYSASRNTVRDAIKLLATRGMVEPRPGQGTFVVQKINPFVTTLTGDPESGQGGGEGRIYVAEVEAGRRSPTVSDPRVEVQRANEAIADALRIKEGDQVVGRHYQRFIDGIPFSLQTSFYPMSLVLQGATRLIEATDITEGTVVYLDEKLGVKQVGYRDSIQVRPPNDQEAVFFRIPADGQIPVFEVYRIAFDQDRKRVRLTITVYPADRNRLVVSVGAVPIRESDAVTSGDGSAVMAEDTPSRQG